MLWCWSLVAVQAKTQRGWRVMLNILRLWIFSEEMLNRAKEKYAASNLDFLQADITRQWPFDDGSFDLVTCNLILEHIEDLDFVFFEAMRVLKPDGYFFY